VSEKTASICCSVVEMAHQDVRWIYTGAIWLDVALMTDQPQESQVAVLAETYWLDVDTLIASVLVRPG